MSHSNPIASVRQRCTRELDGQQYCTFREVDWSELGIDLTALARYWDEVLQHKASRASPGRHDYLRALIVGELASGSARLFSKADCPIKTESILDDYDEELARSPTLLALVRLIIEFSSNEFVGRSKTRFCAEFFSRRHEAKAELGPHHDGATVLFFLILENSMQGGELRLFRKPPVETAARSSSVNSLETLPGQRGDGYCILETASAKSGQILHGCGMWHLPKIGTGDRRSLRVSVACV